MRARRVALPDLPCALGEPWVDPARGVLVREGAAYVPVRAGHAPECEIPERVEYRGRGFFMLGDVAVIRGTAPAAGEIARIVALRKPRGILLIRSVCEATRTPDCVVLYGSAGEVRHREDGYTYLLDPARVMFAQGNLPEKRRLAGLIRAGTGHERVADMFAGIGYFSVPMAGAGAAVHAMEINPAAFPYLLRTAAENGLSGRITAECGDCRDLLAGTYDRIVMGHFDAIRFLPHALCHVRPGSVIHLHSLADATGEIRRLAAGAGFSADVEVHKVKKYRPHTWHLVADITIA